MTTVDVIGGVRQCLIESGFDETAIAMNARLQGDIVFRLEERFGVRIDDATSDQLAESRQATVGTLVRLVESHEGA